MLWKSVKSLQQKQQECIYGRTLEEREKYCKYCSALCEARIEQDQSEVDETDKMTSKSNNKPNIHNELSHLQTTLYEIATILSKYEDKDGSPLEQIRDIVRDATINSMNTKS